MEIMNFYALCRLCAKDIGDKGYNCGNCDGLLQTIKDLYGVEVRVCVTTYYYYIYIRSFCTHICAAFYNLI